MWRIGSVYIFLMHPRFLQWSMIIPEKWKLKFESSRTSAHYQSPKLLGSSPPVKNKQGIWDTHLQIIQYIGKIWDGWQKYKPLIIWDFPNIWKLGLSSSQKQHQCIIYYSKICKWKLTVNYLQQYYKYNLYGLNGWVN